MHAFGALPRKLSKITIFSRKLKVVIEIESLMVKPRIRTLWTVWQRECWVFAAQQKSHYEKRWRRRRRQHHTASLDSKRVQAYKIRSGIRKKRNKFWRTLRRQGESIAIHWAFSLVTLVFVCKSQHFATINKFLSISRQIMQREFDLQSLANFSYRILERPNVSLIFLGVRIIVFDGTRTV
jgi:hypothetical protein